jgi:hypothetical protein
MNVGRIRPTAGPGAWLYLFWNFVPKKYTAAPPCAFGARHHFGYTEAFLYTETFLYKETYAFCPFLSTGFKKKEKTLE